jgi:hypothetical protein
MREVASCLWWIYSKDDIRRPFINAALLIARSLLALVFAVPLGYLAMSLILPPYTTLLQELQKVGDCFPYVSRGHLAGSVVSGE